MKAGVALFLIAIALIFLLLVIGGWVQKWWRQHKRKQQGLMPWKAGEKTIEGTRDARGHQVEDDAYEVYVYRPGTQYRNNRWRTVAEAERQVIGTITVGAEDFDQELYNLRSQRRDRLRVLNDEEERTILGRRKK